MSLLPQLPDIAQLPLHAQLMLAIIAGSGLLCLVIVLAGGLFSAQLRLRHAGAGLPPVPERFPRGGDQLFTALFIAFILWTAAHSLLAPPEAEPSGELTWGWVALGLASHLGLYTPMLVRYVWVHPRQPLSRPWWQYLALPMLVWGCIYVPAALLEGVGFNSWLIEVTQCPEHQDVVRAFSEGDVKMKLYITLSAVLIAPVVEECCFRGFLYTTLRRWGGIAAATLASALLFGAIHSSLAQMLPLTLFGIVQCIAYEKTRSLWLPVATHALFNAVSLLVAGITLTP